MAHRRSAATSRAFRSLTTSSASLRSYGGGSLAPVPARSYVHTRVRLASCRTSLEPLHSSMLAPPVSRSTVGLPSPQQTSASCLVPSPTANFASIEGRAAGSADGEAAVAVAVAIVDALAIADALATEAADGVAPEDPGLPVQAAATRSGAASN